ncbi:hypothetical protein CC2G_015300 [Coprinopsis cinerea AmutBmut pab1-1]|nr:hypothetical protein CC2G_015300 [Coprinopsis cinerea AmutBmut pab1-1]
MEGSYGRRIENIEGNGYLGAGRASRGANNGWEQVGVHKEEEREGGGHKAQGETCSSRFLSETRPGLSVRRHLRTSNAIRDASDCPGLKESIFMRQPPGFDDGTGRVCVLKRSLYGLKQAGNVWNHELNSKLEDFDFKQLKSDYCCYIRYQDDDLTILLVWVDDIIAASTTDALNDQIESELAQHFEIKSLGQPSLILGLQIQQDDHYISLSQSHYIDTLLKRFGLENANPVSTPIDPNVKLDAFDSKDGNSLGEEVDPRISSGYATMIGSLMYLALGTRPEICYAVNRLAQYTSRPRAVHFTALKRIFRYLKGTKHFALTFGGLDDEEMTEDLHIYTDADWANGPDRKSISGYVITLAGGAIAWSSKKQNTVALSTAEAEYVATTHAAKQVLWHRHLLEELEFFPPETSTIFSDNQAAIAISRHPEFHPRTKHIDLAYHFLRDLVANNTLEIVYVRTDLNLADLFTKGLPRSRHQDLTYEIGVISRKGEC